MIPWTVRIQISAMPREHNYSVNVIWTGNTGTRNFCYQAYKRDHEIKAAGKPPIPGSSDPKFREILLDIIRKNF